MPRRHRALKFNLPPRSVQIPVQVLLNKDIRESAYKLYSLIVALSYKRGNCNLNDTQLAELMNCSRQYVGRLLGELSANDLVESSTLDDGQRQIIALDPSDSDDDASLIGRRLFEPAGETLGQAPPTGGRAPRPSLPPHAAVLPTGNDSNAVYVTNDNTIYVTDDNINAVHEEEDSSIRDIDSSSSSRPVYGTNGNIKPVYVTDDNIKPVIDAEFAEISARWVRYFGDISRVEGDLLGDYLADPELAETAAASGETAAAWILAAIEETALNEARRPGSYFRKVLNDWLRKKQKGKKDDHHPQAGPEPAYDPAGEAARRAELLRQIAELEAAVGDD